MHYYGKYRGVVVDNRDPSGLARLKVSMPALAGTARMDWALPCLPPGVPPLLPEIGDTVWIEFEAGDVSTPIWCGVFWTAQSRPPPMPAAAPPFDTWSVRTSEGAIIEIGPTGIVLDNAQGARMTLAGPAVSINRGALEIV